MVGDEPGDVLFIQFAREPVPGQVKTRMLSALSPAEACRLHRELVLWTTRALIGAALGEVELHVAGRASAVFFRQCRELGVRRILTQSGRDLGERMYRAIQSGLETHAAVILVGSDAPQLDAAYLRGAIAALAGAEVVLGPAVDGGYVLIGARRLERAWFDGVEWGSDRVFAETVRRIEVTGSRWRALLPLQDIDRPQDLPLWRAISGDSA